MPYGCIEEGEGALRMAASAGLADEPVDSLESGNETPAGLAVASGRTVTVEDWSQESRFEVPAHLDGLGIGSSVAVPIDGERKALGVIESHCPHPGAFSDQDVYFLRSLANVLAHMIERQVAVDKGMLHDHITGLQTGSCSSTGPLTRSKEPAGARRRSPSSSAIWTTSRS